MEMFLRLRSWAKGLISFNNKRLMAGRPPLESLPRSRSRTDYELIKSRPLSLEDRYQLVRDLRDVEGVFGSLTQELLNLSDSVSSAARAQGSGRVVLTQLGQTDDRRPYIFLKPMSESGWLVELEPAGWRISRAEQIVSRGIFMRSDNDAWDVATVWTDPEGEGLTRIRSQRLGRELMTVGEYERRICHSIREIFTYGQRH